jgi:very-short-patch-repair endonuclease
VIYLSVTYAKSADGKLRYQLGPLNAENGWRRLNVLTTRARKHMRVFSSIRGDDINVATTPSRGAKLIHDFLVYAELGRLDNPVATAGAETESPFEAQVMAELVRRGLTLVPQVGAAGYRIDFGVLDEDHPGRYVCGIECDGVAYHSSETARDRDRLRQQVLEDRGWIIHRVWSTDWFKDRDGQIGRILGLVEQSRERLTRASRGGASQRVTPMAAKPSTMPAGQTVLSLASRGTEPDNAAPPHVSSPRAGSSSDGYIAPSAAAYRMTPGRDRYVGESLLEASAEKLLGSILAVVENEGPIHEEELVTRVAGMWGNRAGSRIAARIRAASADAERSGHIERRSSFLWPPSGRVSVRSRVGLQVAAEHICSEEYREAALTILETGYAFNREDLRVEVRALLGFSRTGHLLEAEIDRAIQGLMDEGTAGEASAGIGLRE